MNCIIVDDIAADRAVIERFCKRSGLFDHVKGFAEPTRAIKHLREHDVDLIFLDIHMPKLSGFDFLSTLQEPPCIIFISNDDATATRAFEVDAIDFLLKPVSFQRFLKAVQKAADFNLSKAEAKHARGNANELFIKEGTKYFKLHLDTIYYIEALGDYVKFVTAEGEFVVHSTMKKTLENLPDENFMKVHRSFIVNIVHINDLKKDEIDLLGCKIPVSKVNQEALKKKLKIN